MSDVDRRYFNDNSGLGPGSNYAVINVKPGYQKMCGQRALEYVRYRHTDTDIVRGARQQDFLRQVRGAGHASKLIGKTGKLIDIFADNTASDIKSSSALRRLLGLMLGVKDKPIKQVKFHGRLGESYVTRLPAQVKAAVRQFLYVKKDRGALARQRKRDPMRAAARSARQLRREADRRHGREPRAGASWPSRTSGSRSTTRASSCRAPPSPRMRCAPTRSRTAAAGATAPTRWWSSPASSASTTA